MTGTSLSKGHLEILRLAGKQSISLFFVTLEDFFSLGALSYIFVFLSISFIPLKDLALHAVLPSAEGRLLEFGRSVISLTLSFNDPAKEIRIYCSSNTRLCPFELKMVTIIAFLSTEATKEISDRDIQLHFSVGLLGLEYLLVDLIFGIIDLGFF